jgi:phosphatidylserine/phosphatidylglycerophosphate/cardiolipin synthase-like enzyme
VRVLTNSLALNDAPAAHVGDSRYRKLLVVGSMNLDLRSQLQNSEVAVLIRNASLAKQALQMIEPAMMSGAYRVESVDQELVWRAPQGSALQDSTTEPDASAGLKLLLKLLGPFAPEEML